jgi:hypothetical protein
MTENTLRLTLARALSIRDGAPVAPAALAIAFLAGLAASAALAFGVRAAARDWFDVPGGLKSLKTGALIVSVLMPVLGNCFGFFMAYRKPNRRSLLMFLAPGAVLVTLGLIILLSQLPSSPSTAAVLATVAVALIPTALIVPLLLRLRHNPHAEYHRNPARPPV